MQDFLHEQYAPKGPRTQIMGFQASNTIILMVFGPYKTLVFGSLDP